MSKLLEVHYLYAFDYKPQKPPSEVKHILFIQTFSLEQSKTSLTRLSQIFPNAEFHVLSKAGFNISDLNGTKISNFHYHQSRLPEDFCDSEEGWRIRNIKPDLVFFGIGLDHQDAVQFSLSYDNVFNCIKRMGLMNIAHIIDRNYVVRPLAVHDSWTLPADVRGNTIHFPWTLMADSEVYAIYDLAAEGPGEGAIVNIGQFRGSSSIVMAKASKLKGREKLYSFDPLNFPGTKDIFKKNNVDDWIIYTQTTSQEGVKEWGKREDRRIRLLFVDGDHSYEGCKRDILDWAPFIVPGGLLCVHDYCNFDAYWSSFTGVIKGVHDALEQSGEFHDFRRKETIFIANKKG